MKTICLLATVPFAVRAFLIEHIRLLSSEYHVTVATNLRKDNFQETGLNTVRFVNLPFSRNPDPLNDLACVMGLIRFFKKEHFDLIHSITPKAGLLSMMAGRLAGIKVRMHTFTGQVWATKSGIARLALKTIDRFFAGLATHIFVDSTSQRDLLIKEGVIRSDHSEVLGAGSISGVDTVRFGPDAALRKITRAELGFTDQDVVFLFLGRLKKDKGVLTLAKAYRSISKDWPEARLLIVGPDEEGLRHHLSILSQGTPMVFVGHTTVPQKHMNAADVFCLPSRREGFGQVIIEAACAGIPAIASHIYGITDAVDEGKTGLLHAPDSVEELADCMKQMLANPDLRVKMGAAARERVLKEFPKERLTAALRDAYHRILGD